MRVWKLDSGRSYLFRYADATQFFLDGRGTDVWAAWPHSLTLEDAATYLLGPIFGFVLRLRGVTCLHASAVVSNDRAIALAGPPGAGKSTTAAALASRGLPVLSDDILPLEARDSSFWVQPGYPRLNLWPDSAGSLYGSPERLPLITPGWPKRFVDVAQPPFAFHRDAAPLQAVYLLEGNSEEVTPQVQPANDQAGLISLVANTYSNYLLDATMRASEFALLGRLASRVPLRRLRFAPVPESFSLLPETLLADVASLPPPP